MRRQRFLPTSQASVDTDLGAGGEVGGRPALHLDPGDGCGVVPDVAAVAVVHAGRGESGRRPGAPVKDLLPGGGRIPDDGRLERTEMVGGRPGEGKVPSLAQTELFAPSARAPEMLVPTTSMYSVE